MHFIAKTVFVLGAGVLLLAGAGAADAASYPGSCGVRAAHHRVHDAERTVARAQARLSEARHVERATRAASDRYGHDVGQWVRLARGTGWPWGQIPTLMYIIDRESGGNPAAKNPTSTASGLLQFLAEWWSGKWNPFDPRVNLSHGYRAWREVGWQPWALTAP